MKKLKYFEENNNLNLSDIDDNNVLTVIKKLLKTGDTNTIARILTDPNKKPNIFSPLLDLGYVDQPVLTGKIKWIEYKGDEISPTYRIFCPEAEETYTVGECCIIKKEEPKNIQPKKKGNK
jgi:hypothetical protein